MKKHHSILYFLEFGIIGSGFAILLSISMKFYSQLAVVGTILILYIIIGLLHHRAHHDICIKVVLEYILISVLIFALFVFLNISRI